MTERLLTRGDAQKLEAEAWNLDSKLRHHLSRTKADSSSVVIIMHMS